MNREFLLGLLQRLRCCVNYPVISDEMTIGIVQARLEEIVTALDEACTNKEHAKATIDEWVYGNSFFPAPAEIRSLACSLYCKFQPPPPPVCDQCGSSGWKEIEIKKGWDTFNAVVPCDCRKKAS